MKTTAQTVWYIDDHNVKHYTVIHSAQELCFLKLRFDFVQTIKPNEV